MTAPSPSAHGPGVQRRPGRKLVVGLTGNIACGKSTVGSILARLGARVIDADLVAHAVLEEPEVRQQIRRHFGAQVFTAEGAVDRPALGRLVFSDPEKLALLEHIVHPRVLEIILEAVERAPEPVVVVDAIKLLESSLASHCHQVWVVVCPQQVQIRRLREGRGLSHSEALMRVRAQPPQEEKVRAATVVIDGSGPVEHAERQVLEAWRKLIEPELARPSGSR